MGEDTNSDSNRVIKRTLVVVRKHIAVNGWYLSSDFRPIPGARVDLKSSKGEIKVLDFNFEKFDRRKNTTFRATKTVNSPDGTNSATYRLDWAFGEESKVSIGSCFFSAIIGRYGRTDEATNKSVAPVEEVYLPELKIVIPADADGEIRTDFDPISFEHIPAKFPSRSSESATPASAESKSDTSSQVGLICRVNTEQGQQSWRISVDTQRGLYTARTDTGIVRQRREATVDMLVGASVVPQFGQLKMMVQLGSFDKFFLVMKPDMKLFWTPLSGSNPAPAGYCQDAKFEGL